MKLERLVSMIYMLLNHEVVSASVLAEKYNVSQRTIYRDMDVICAAGFPVVSHQGVNGGYGIIEGYKLDRSLLGAYDVNSLITVLQSISTLFGEDEKAGETIRKLQTIRTEPLAETLTMDIGSRKEMLEMIRHIREAASGRMVIRFDYVNLKSERTLRTVEPVRLMYKHEAWYLYAYCRARADYREFRLSRMSSLELSEERFEPRELPPQRGTSEKKRDSESADATTVRLRFSAGVLAAALDRFYYADKRYSEDGSLLVTFSVAAISPSSWLAESILSFGDGVEVLEPGELIEDIRQRIEKMRNLYIKG
ncbi:YafY family protein [Paenibacillus sp. UNC499MF]|uniref:helix-turn-helix transcriptional regulator n=1 Tax=Paenibacillus sp. UNC499MF TaxID=1502751 RepID=UPI0008A01A00|nr:YafY family protein [Paenibacillus sp. UNC499MF]SEG47348.1 Predicted DNA-binding transcriptional regulator YafY, contains an HTH and WYL domains [Paenibacillus sp. UNC499MF]